MSTAHTLSREKDIDTWIGSINIAEEEAKRAAQLLANEPDHLEALKKLTPSLENKVVNVFFSYKKKDEATATAIVDLLRTYSAEKLCICYQAEFTKEMTGRKWREKIKQEIRRANWFIFLLPDPSDDWDWCLYETGLFDRQATSADRMFCLHHPDADIPDPIEDYHHVAATIPDMEGFLRMVYVADDPIPGLKALNPSIESKISQIAKEFVDTIRAPLIQKIYEPSITLKIDDAERLMSKEELDSATIESSNFEAITLFDYSEQPQTWGELRKFIEEPNGDARWREELYHAIHRISQGRNSSPVQAVFQSVTGKIYRPILYAADKAGHNGPVIRFHISFIEDTSAIDSSTIPPTLSNLASILRFAFRFRWEILEKFATHLKTIDDIEKLNNAISRLENDWESRGIGSQSDVLNLISEEKRQRVLDMMFAWKRVRSVDGKGELDMAINENDIAACTRILKDFLPMNQEFMEIVTDRFNELISRIDQ